MTHEYRLNFSSTTTSPPLFPDLSDRVPLKGPQLQRCHLDLLKVLRRRKIRSTSQGLFHHRINGNDCLYQLVLGVSHAVMCLSDSQRTLVRTVDSAALDSTPADDLKNTPKKKLTWQDYGRAFCRLVSFVENPTQVVQVGLRYEVDSSDDESDNDNNNRDSESGKTLDGKELNPEDEYVNISMLCRGMYPTYILAIFLATRAR